jgi:Methyltransferase domain
MNTRSPTLVVVAYQLDEMLFFSSVCNGAVVLIVGKHCRCGYVPSNTEKIAAMHAALGIRQAVCLESSQRGVSLRTMLSSWLHSTDANTTVYTNGPFQDSFRNGVALVTSEIFGSVLIPATASAASEAYCLSRESLVRKAELLNSHCLEHRSRVEARNCCLLDGSIAGCEAFARVSNDDIIRATALTTGRVFGRPDLWSFKSSSFERQRYSVTCELLLEVIPSNTDSDILEIGACEGEMTAQLRQTFPHAHIRAVEPHPVFVSSLKTRFCHDRGVQVLEQSIADIQLEADVVLLAEALYHLDDEVVRRAFATLRGQYLLLSVETLRSEWRNLLRSMGWREVISRDIWPRLEPVDGRESGLISLRAGTTVQLWEHSELQTSAPGKT